MYLASFLVITAVALMLFYWVGFLLWAWRSGQFDVTQEMRWRPIDDEPIAERGHHGQR
jgi:nitrogen fixation-related uncharacterized protein